MSGNHTNIYQRILLFICDVAILLCIPISSIYIYFFLVYGFDFKIGGFIMDRTIYISNIMIYLTIFYIMDLYNDRRKYSDGNEIATIILTVILASLLSIVFLYFVGKPPMGRGIFLIYILSMVLCVSGHRCLYSWLLFRILPATKAVLLVDHGNSNKIAEQFESVKDNTILITGAFDIRDNLIQQGEKLPNEDAKSLLQAIKTEKPDIIIADVHDSFWVKMITVMLWCKKHGMQIMNLSEAYEKILFRIPLSQYAKHLDTITQQTGAKDNYFRAKGLFERCIAATLLIMSTPLSLLTALAIKLDSRGSVLYRQKRVGRNGKHFYLVKFRSMVQDAEKETGPVWASENDPRITRVGRIIRALRIDELPQLINVIKGDMGLVGPRPERPEFVYDFLGGSSEDQWEIPLYSERLTVKPGITGWAQIMYPYAKSREQSITKLEYDLYYIKNISFLLDITIMLKTVRVALFGWISR